ncbi:uncharacterized protein M6B38_128110 [Iris pallida]|uniref:Uncharacterized protein n=1 Tax=Iris pallida TaxID=29817 RepID=A0AAX6G6D6_IRIPA|nr:uncharacterized protein M6B38_128110 [Iris pallida]
MAADDWLRWPVLACAAIVLALPAAATAVLLRRRSAEDARLRPSDLWTSCWRCVSPRWLLAYRALVVVVMPSLLVREVLSDGVFSFFFYTQWTFVLVIIYFVIATLISAHGCWIYSKQEGIGNEEVNGLLKHDIEDNGPGTLTLKINNETARLPSENDREVNERRAGSLGYVMQIVYQTCGGAVLLTDIVFWCLLVPTSADHFSVNLIAACMHSLNAVFLLLETALNNLPFPLFRMIYFVYWSFIYVIFQWVLHACGFTWWPYPFMELATPWAPLWYIAIALVHIPCYGSYWLIAKAKNTFFPKFFPHSYTSSF